MRNQLRPNARVVHPGAKTPNPNGRVKRDILVTGLILFPKI
jgi:hypothetical protein